MTEAYEYLQRMYEREKLWGIPHDSFASFVEFSCEGTSFCNNFFGRADEKVWSADDTTIRAASTTLLNWRSKTEPNPLILVMLCWLEKGLIDHLIDWFIHQPCVEELARKKMAEFIPGLLTDTHVLLIQKWAEEEIREDLKVCQEVELLTLEEARLRLQSVMKKIKKIHSDSEVKSKTPGITDAMRASHLRNFLMSNS